jgi:hypothetical protein
MAITWPAKMEQLEEAGYGYTGRAGTCHGCNARFLWFITPAGKWMPMTALKDSRLVAHATVCEQVKAFREANKKHAERTEAKKPKQGELF